MSGDRAHRATWQTELLRLFSVSMVQLIVNAVPTPPLPNQSHRWSFVPGRELIALGIVLAIMGALMFPGSGAPWTERHHYASAAFATIARNHLQLGLRTTQGASVLRVDPRRLEPVAVYAHHPFGYPLALAGVFRIAGASELAARATAIACSLTTTCLLFVLMRRAFDWPTAVAAAALFGLAPGTLCDGRIVSLEQPLLVAIVAAIWLFDQWLTSGRRRDYWLLVSVLVVGMAIEWQAYYLSAILPIGTWLLGPRPMRWRPVVGLLTIAPVMLAIFLLHIWLADFRQLGDLYQTLLFRAGLLGATQQLGQLGQVTDYSIGEFFTRLGEHLRTELTWPLCGLALVGLGVICWTMRREPIARRRLAIPLLLAAPGVCHTILFSNAMYVHDCLSILYLPAAAAAGALALRCLWVVERWRLAGLVATALIVVVFARSSLAEVAALREIVEPDAWIVGTELAEITRPDDAVLILGMPYDPAVFWYAQRELMFAGEDGALVGRFREKIDIRDPTVVAVLQGTLEYLAMPSPADPGSRQFYDRTAKTWSFVREYFIESGRTENLIIYRAGPNKPARKEDAGRKNAASPDSSAAATNAASFSAPLSFR